MIPARIRNIVGVMQAATVEVLVSKGKFDPQIAVALAEAIDMALNTSQLVTVPILDARVAAIDAQFAHFRTDIKGDIAELRGEIKDDIGALKGELKELKAELVRWVFLAMLGSVALSAGASSVVKALQF
jgi:hypothetical protein